MDDVAKEDSVVGHKTFCDDDGNRWHEPLRQSKADELWKQVEAARERREQLMPTEADCLRMLGDLSERLRELGWRDAIYCPKDGTPFDVIEFGSTGIHTCHYDGEWPNGHWWVHAAGDLWPSRPILFRPKADEPVRAHLEKQP